MKKYSGYDCEVSQLSCHIRVRRTTVPKCRAWTTSDA